MVKEINTIKERLKAPTPDFWKKVRKYAYWGLLVAAIGTSIASGIGAPIGVIVGLSALDTACVTVIGMASLTKK